MTSASWRTLIHHLDMGRVIIPVEMSKSPDVLFVLRNMALLCFQVKTGTQDNSLAQLVTELAKCPYLSRPDVTKNKVGGTLVAVLVLPTLLFRLFSRKMLLKQRRSLSST